jgi:hypothetical protein
MWQQPGGESRVPPSFGNSQHDLPMGAGRASLFGYVDRGQQGLLAPAVLLAVNVVHGACVGQVVVRDLVPLFDRVPVMPHIFDRLAVVIDQRVIDGGRRGACALRFSRIFASSSQFS